MNLIPQPTQVTHDTEPTDAARVTSSASESAYKDDVSITNIHKTIDANTIVLADALIDNRIAWRIHNCKISEKTITQDLPLPFLYHYDSLSDAVKETNPLTPKLLAQFDTLMTADAAAKLIGIDRALLIHPWHIKVTGSLVVFSEALQLAVRLHWTNTAKDTQQIYSQKQADAQLIAFKDWQFFGRVDVLYKNLQQPLISIDEENVDDDTVIRFSANSDYQYLPATHALTLIAKLEAHKSALPWFEAAIMERVA